MTSTEPKTRHKETVSTLPIADLNDALASEKAASASAAKNEAFWSVRQTALEALDKQGLPASKKLERWKYSPLHKVWRAQYLTHFLREGWQSAPHTATQTPAASEKTWQPDHAVSLPLYDGHCLPGDLARLAEIPGLSIQHANAIEDTTLQARVNKQLATLSQADGLCAATLALSSDPIVITLTEAFDATRPLVITHHKSASENVQNSDDIGTDTAENTPAADYTTIFLRLENQQKLTLIEQYSADSQSQGLKTVLSLLDLAPDARCDHLRLMAGLDTVQQHFYTRIALAANSQYHAGNYSVGAGFIRSVIEPQLNAPGAHCQVSGAYLACNNAHHDHRIFVDHLAPHCTSQSFVKGIAGRGGTAVFNGRIHIAPGAKQSDGALQNRNLLLDNTSTVHTKPELEIYNDDVKCSHGATVSQLDHQQLLYLQSRGLDQEAAVHLLLESYLLETLAELPDAFAKTKYLKNWLVTALKNTVPDIEPDSICQHTGSGGDNAAAKEAKEITA